MDITKQDHDEIVALWINDVVYFDQQAIDKAKEHGKVDRIIPRSLFKLVSELDNHPKWIEYSKYPTLFTITEYNEWCKLPEGKPIC